MTPHEMTAAAHRALLDLKRFLDECHSDLTGRDWTVDNLQKAFYATHMRIHALVSSLARLDDIECATAIAAISRTVLELWIDQRSLRDGVYPDADKRYWLFVSLEKLRWAKRAVAFDTLNPGALIVPPTDAKAFVANQGTIEADSAALWAIPEAEVGRRPPHWSGQGDIRARSASVGLEAKYVELYNLLTSFSHAGATGIAGLQKDSYLGLIYMCLRVVTDAACDSLDVMRDRVGLAKADAQAVGVLRQLTGHYMAEAEARAGAGEVH